MTMTIVDNDYGGVVLSLMLRGRSSTLMFSSIRFGLFFLGSFLSRPFNFLRSIIISNVIMRRIRVNNVSNGLCLISGLPVIRVGQLRNLNVCLSNRRRVNLNSSFTFRISRRDLITNVFTSRMGRRRTGRGCNYHGTNMFGYGNYSSFRSFCLVLVGFLFNLSIKNVAFCPLEWDLLPI